MKQEPGTRIVSKAEYANNVIEKTGRFSTGIIVCLLCLLCAVGIGVVLFFCVQSFLEHTVSSGMLLFATTLVSFMIFSVWFTFRLGLRFVKGAKNFDTGIPLTRGNTANLPAPDSLVRASQEPVQEQQAVLLRAAIETQEEYAEQLVRASGGIE